MNDTTSLRRDAVVVSLVLAPVLMLASSALQPPFVADHAERLREVDAAGAAAWVSNSLFIATQVPMLVAFLGLARLLRDRTPRLAVAAGILGVLATFGETVMGGTGLVYLTMASDSANRELFAGVWQDMESSPVMVYGLLGFGGTALTLILLAIGLLRSRIVPRWVPVLMWSFLVLELVGSGLSAYASYAAVLCLGTAFAALARHLGKSQDVDAGAAGERVPVSG